MHVQYILVTVGDKPTLVLRAVPSQLIPTWHAFVRILQETLEERLVNALADVSQSAVTAYQNVVIGEALHGVQHGRPLSTSVKAGLAVLGGT